MSRSLNVWFNHQLIGRVNENRELWSFHYDDNWLTSADSFDLSPALLRSANPIVDGASLRPVQWFFDNLLPEENARAVLTQDKDFEHTDSFSLLAYYGQESAGALTLLKADETITNRGELSLTFAELNQRIGRLPIAPLSSPHAKRMSLAGAQHKMAVIYRDGHLFEPIGNTLSTHILKPDHRHPEHYPHTAVNEWFVMQLAKDCGLNVPLTYFRQVPDPIFIIERFDRTKKAEQALVRDHTLDGCQLLSVVGWAKYTGSTIKNLNRLIDLCRVKALTRQAIFKWMLFNTLVGNGDAHLKNLSVFCQPQGNTLTPHYDLLSTTVYHEPGKWGEAELSWPIGNAQYFNQVTVAELIRFGEAIGLKKRFLDKAITEMVTNINHRASTLYDAIVKTQTDSRPHAGELRHLRQIIHGVIKDMTKQLSD